MFENQPHNFDQISPRLWMALLVFFLLGGVLAFSNILSAFFLSDDFDIINSAIRNGPFIIYGGFVRPIISLSVWIDYHIWGLNPIGYHLTNIVIHSLNSFLVALISSILLNSLVRPPLALSLPFFSGILFLLLPCHTESVSWIAGRTDVIATFFILASFYTYLLFKYHPVLIYLLLSIFLFGCALLSKESVITYPIIILLAQIYTYLVNETNDIKKRKVLYLPLLFLLIFILYLAFRFILIGEIIGGYGDTVHTTFDPLLSLEIISKSLVKTIIPLNFLTTLNINQWIFPIYTLIGLPAIIISLVTFILSAVAMLNKKALTIMHRIDVKLLLALFLITMFLVALGPVINLGISFIGTDGDRFVYFPSVFLSILMGVLLSIMARNPNITLWIFVILSFIYANFLYILNNNWMVAGQISKNIIGELAKIHGNKGIVFINLPDNINGAYIFRNGMTAAVSLFNRIEYINNLFVISFQGIQNENDGVELEYDSGIISVKFFNSTFGGVQGTTKFWINGRLSADSNIGANIAIGQTFKTNLYEIFDLKSQGYNLRFSNAAYENNRIMFYSKGKLANLSHR